MGLKKCETAFCCSVFAEDHIFRRLPSYDMKHRGVLLGILRCDFCHWQLQARRRTFRGETVVLQRERGSVENDAGAGEAVEETREEALKLDLASLDQMRESCPGKKALSEHAALLF